MRKFGFVAVTLLVFVSSVTAQHMWMADPAHSAIQFKVKHMGFSLVTGRFNNFEVTVSTQNKDDFTHAQVEITIQSNSIFTHHEQRDYHLRSRERNSFHPRRTYLNLRWPDQDHHRYPYPPTQ